MNLTKTEHGDWLRFLHAWLPTGEFRTALDRLEVTQGDYLLTDPRAAFYRDAYCALQFATLVGASQVRLVADDRPDFQISVAGSEASFEVTEADTPDRKRGQEVQDRRARMVPNEESVEDFPYEDWLTSNQADVALRAAAERKDRSTYDPMWGLVILLNQTEFGAHQKAIEDLMIDATAAVRNRFASVWVLWKGVAYNTWQNSRVGSGELRRPDASVEGDRGG